MGTERHPSQPDADSFGDLDGEAIDLASVTLSGTVPTDRRHPEGERLVLIVEGTIADTVTVKRETGRLVRVHKLKVTSAAPPGAQLAGEVDAFLQAFNEARDGTPLPFEPDDEPPDGLSAPDEDQP